ncbi:hypothetical protein HYX00_01530 [Candidatus Woesearchaeota archaeon]|nr:hypothetical protein [Candidatus Woesearchaeota archaeon]
MKKLINGNNYRFILNSFNCSDGFSFYIEARHKNTNRHSLINNVNCILSGLGIDAYNKKFWESKWVVTKNEATKFFKKAHDFLTDDDFREYVERYLDLDRSLGEWNKI